MKEGIAALDSAIGGFPENLFQEFVMSNPTRFLTVRQWTEQHSWPPLGGVRHLIFHASRNGFDAVIRRVGRRILLNEQFFLDFIERHGVREHGVHDGLKLQRTLPRTRVRTTSGKSS